MFFSRPRDENKDVVSNAPGELSSLEPNWRRTRSVSASSPHSSLQVFPSHASPITPSRYNPVYISRPSSVMSNRSSKVQIFYYFDIKRSYYISLTRLSFHKNFSRSMKVNYWHSLWKCVCSKPNVEKIYVIINGLPILSVTLHSKWPFRKVKIQASW